MMDTISYLWRYYKVPISLLLFLFVIFFSILSNYQSKTDDIWSAYLINANISDKEIEYLQDKLDGVLKDEQNKEVDLFFDTSINFSVAETNQESFDQMARFTTLVAGKEIDFIITDTATASHYGFLDGFLNLENWLLTEEINVDEELVYRLETNKEEVIPIGIRLPNDLVALIPKNSSQTPLSLLFMNVLVDHYSLR